jgi:PAS domain-containing protein
MSTDQTAWRQSVETSQPYQIEYRMRRHDGEYIWMLARGLPVLDADGHVAAGSGHAPTSTTGWRRPALEIMSRN